MAKVKKYGRLLGIIVIGMTGVILGASLFTKIFTGLGIMETYEGKILLTWLSMLIGFGILPTLLLERKNLTMADMGFGRIRKIEALICLVALGAAILYIVVGRQIDSAYLLLVASFQNLGVALFEEYFSKAVLFNAMKPITERKGIPILFCACIFAYILHNSDSFGVNLFYRFPMALILGILYSKTENLYLPITLHFINNLLVTSILQ